jgi:hypothetical protein
VTIMKQETNAEFHVQGMKPAGKTLTENSMTQEQGRISKQMLQIGDCFGVN